MSPRRATALFLSITLLLLAGCAASSGGRTRPFAGEEHEPMPDDFMPVIFDGEDPSCPFKEIGTIEAWAELEVSGDELANAAEHHRSDWLENAEEGAWTQFRWRARSMGGHGIMNIERSTPGDISTPDPEIGDSAFREYSEERTSAEYTLGGEKPRYMLTGTVIRFLDVECTE